MVWWQASTAPTYRPIEPLDSGKNTYSRDELHLNAADWLMIASYMQPRRLLAGGGCVAMVNWLQAMVGHVQFYIFKNHTVAKDTKDG